MTTKNFVELRHDTTTNFVVKNFCHTTLPSRVMTSHHLTRMTSSRLTSLAQELRFKKIMFFFIFSSNADTVYCLRKDCGVFDCLDRQLSQLSAGFSLALIPAACSIVLVEFPIFCIHAVQPGKMCTRFCVPGVCVNAHRGCCNCFQPGYIVFPQYPTL